MKIKIISLLLIFVLLFSLCACAKKEKENDTGSGEETTETISAEEAVARFLEKMESAEAKESAFYQYEDLSAYFKLGEYRGIRYPDDPMISVEVSDEEAANYLQYIILSNFAEDESYQVLTEGVVQFLDTAVIDYVGSFDGVPNPKATDDGMELVIGSDTFIEGFEDGLIGHRVGETVGLDLRFSPYYGDSEVAGKAVHFDVTIREIRRAPIPEMTIEEFNEAFQSEYADFDAVRADLKADLIAEKTASAKNNITEYCKNAVIANAVVAEALPEKEMQHYRDYFTGIYKNYAGETDFETFVTTQLGVTMEEFNAEAEKYARESVLTDLLIRTVCEKEKIECGRDELKEMILGAYDASAGNFADAQAFLNYYESQYGAYYFEDSLLWNKVRDVIYQSAVKE